MTEPQAADETPTVVTGETQRAIRALGLGLALGLIARIFARKETRAWREPSEI